MGSILCAHVFNGTFSPIRIVNRSRQIFWYTSLFARLQLDYKRDIALKYRFLVAERAMREEVFVLLLIIIARLVERVDA